MRKSFPGYYAPSQEDIAEMLKKGTVVLDTNVLLNLYQFTPETREHILAILNRLGNRLWIPHQVGHEYQRKRIAKIDEQLNSYKKLLNLYRSFGNSLSAYKQHPFVVHDKLSKRAKEFVEKEIASIEQDTQEILKKTDPKHIYPQLCEDLHERITKLFDEKVGPRWDQKTLEERRATVRIRYAGKIPPGYKDSSGKETDAGKEHANIGDGLLWLQLLEKAEKEPKAYILVTDDSKTDWWLQSDGRQPVPRPELIEEMKLRSQSDFWMLSRNEFVQLAPEPLGLTRNQSAEDEVEALREQESIEHPFDILIEPTAIYLRRKQLRELYEEAMRLLTELSGLPARVSPLTIPIALDMALRKNLITESDCPQYQKALNKAVDALTSPKSDEEDLEYYIDWLAYLIEKLDRALNDMIQTEREAAITFEKKVIGSEQYE